VLFVEITSKLKFAHLFVDPIPRIANSLQSRLQVALLSLTLITVAV